MSSSDMNPNNSSPDPQPFSPFQQSPGPDDSQEIQYSWSPLRESPPIEKETQQTQRKNKAEKSNNFVNRIIAIFEEEDVDASVNIFKVPNSLTSAKPEAYVPRQIGLGPIHHLTPEVQQMQMYKVLEAKRIHNGFNSKIEFNKVVEILKQIVASSVRASYNIYLDMDDDVLACTMAVDGMFLIYLLCCYGIKKEVLANSRSLSHLVNSSGRRLAQDTTVQEAMMLENQIPIIVTEVILIIESSKASLPEPIKIVSDVLPRILLGFCEFFSPLKTVENYPHYKALKHAHLLDLLYHLVTLKHSPEINHEEEMEELSSLKELSEKVSKILGPKRARRSLEGLVRTVLGTGKTLAPPGYQRPFELALTLLDLPFSDIGSALKEEVAEKEVFISRASELQKAGVNFCVADHVTDINVQRSTVSFYLPVVKINDNFEVVIRNLAVYEAMIKSETELPILNWYVELMNGLVQTAKDVMVLKKQKIISKSESIDDELVAKIFTGMNKSVELTNIPKNLNDAVEDVKGYYNNVWWVSTSKSMNKCWRTTKKWFPVFVALSALFLLSLQAFCSIYHCSFSAGQFATTFFELSSHLANLYHKLPLILYMLYV